MPQFNHYEVTAVIRFDVHGPLACHEAVREAEARISKALKGDRPSCDDPVSSAHIVSVTVDDVDAVRPRPGAGGKR